MCGYRCCYDFSQHLKGFSTDNWATVTQQQFPLPLRAVLSTNVNINRKKMRGGKTNRSPRTSYSKLDRCFDVKMFSIWWLRVSPTVGENRTSGWLPSHVSNPHRVVLWSHLQYDGHLGPRGVKQSTSPKDKALRLCRHQKRRLENWVEESWNVLIVLSFSCWSLI